MREYVYFSERLARKIVEDNQGAQSSAPKTTLSLRPGGIGGDITWDSSQLDPPTRHAWAQAVDRIVGDHAPWGWDPNGSAMYLRGRSRAFLGDLVGGAVATNAAIVGATYLWEGSEVNLCLFGSRHNLDGALPSVDPNRRRGWFSSHTVGVRQLLTFASFGGKDWDEDLAYAASRGVDDDDLVWNAANIMRGQGLVGNGSRLHADAPSLRGYTVLEGDFEWLARIYWWRSGNSDWQNVAVGAPVFVRTISDKPWTLYGAVPKNRRLEDLKLKADRMTPDRPLPVAADPAIPVRNPRRRWWRP